MQNTAPLSSLNSSSFALRLLRTFKTNPERAVTFVGFSQFVPEGNVKLAFLMLDMTEKVILTPQAEEIVSV